MMTVDNLPTQLPRDASEYFGDALCPLLDQYIDNGIDALKDAAIAIEGKIVPKFKDQLFPLISNISSKKILIIGAGLVSRPVIEYLMQFPEYSLIIAAPSFNGLTPIMDKLKENRQVALLNQEITAGNLGKIGNAIEESDLVISLLPAFMHSLILECVFKNKKHLVTASYTSPEMEKYSESVKKEGLLWLNEVGLDPGLDHLSAMKIIDQVKESDDTLESFISWCGGLPAPEFADNPIGYKFSWSPIGALRATQNPARFLENGKKVEVNGAELLSSARPAKLHPAFSFEGIPNRDSLIYLDKYGLSPKIKTMFRGTLRYSGFSEFMEGLTALGFLSQSPSNPHSSWKDAVKDALGVGHLEDVDYVAAVQSKLSYWSKDKCHRFVCNLDSMHMLSDKTKYELHQSQLETLCALLQATLSYKKGERDMAFMHHEFIVSKNTTPPKKEIITSTLCMFGNEDNSAMSLTVGLPVAVAARLILSGKIRERGVMIPTLSSIYTPMLEKLEQLGIRFVEKRQAYY